jgi:hypothetical protein
VDDTRDYSCRHCFTALLYLATKLAHVGGDVDGLACPPSPSYGLWLSNERTGPPARCHLVLSLQWDDSTFPGDVKPPGLDLWWSIDRVDACVTESYME